MCYLVAKDRYAHGCFALKTTHGKHLAELKSELDQAVGYKSANTNYFVKKWRKARCFLSENYFSRLFKAATSSSRAFKSSSPEGLLYCPRTLSM